MKAVLNKLPDTGGSGKGVSYYRSGSLCPKRVLLDEQLRAEQGTQTYGGKFAADVGTITHELLRLYHTGINDVVIELGDYNLSDEVAEAERLFRGYTKHFSANVWGQVLGAEVQCPANDAEKAKLASFFYQELTARFDMVVRMSQEDVECWHQAGFIDLPGPGVYIVDHKTMARKESNLQLDYQTSDQFLAYPAMWDLLHPEEPCLGMIANCLVRHKNITADSFAQYFVPKATPEQLASFNEWLETAATHIRGGWANRGACLQGYMVCSHLTNGRCFRK
jgi:hypothetical protein